MSSSRRPSTALGYARSAGEAQYPQLWRGLVGLWRPDMGNQGTTLRDWSLGRNHGTLVNGPTYAPGRNGGLVLSFDGVDEYVAIDNNFLVSGVGRVTVSIWVKFDDLNARRHILRKGHGNLDTDSIVLRYEPSGSSFSFSGSAELQFGLEELTGTDFSYAYYAGPLVVGRWYHVAGTWDKDVDGGAVRIYVNGVVGANNNNPKTLAIDPNAVMHIGQNTVDNLYFKGSIDDPGIYSRALTVAEIRAIYLGASPLIRRRTEVGFITAPPQTVTAGAITATVTAHAPTISLGPSALEQTAAAAFPDRVKPGTAGVGLRVHCGQGAAWLEHELDIDALKLHARLMLNVDPNSGTPIAGGSVALLVGYNAAGSGDEVWRLTYNATNRQITYTVATDTPTSITATLIQGLAWHCVDLKIDTGLLSASGGAELWLNGVSVGTLSGGDYSALKTRRVEVGCPLKDLATVGDFYVDELRMSDRRSGPVIPPILDASDSGGDPRWSSVYVTPDELNDWLTDPR